MRHVWETRNAHDSERIKALYGSVPPGEDDRADRRRLPIPWRRRGAERAFAAELARLDGALLDQAEIPAIRYHAELVEVPAAVIQDLVAHPDIGLAKFDDIMVLRPQSVVGEPSTDLDAAPEAVVGPPLVAETGRVVAALFDGLPLVGHRYLAGRLEIDDPDDFASEYGLASEQRHAA